MAARLMWGTPNDAARSINPEAMRRAEANFYALVDPTAVGDTTPEATADWPVVPSTRLIYLAEDEGEARVVAVALPDVESNPDVLAAVEEDLKVRTETVTLIKASVFAGAGGKPEGT